MLQKRLFQKWVQRFLDKPFLERVTFSYNWYTISGTYF
uniref:WSSV156 n=1 Tax=White spot syndrome virus TaxID=342409 RepID=A0A3G5BHY9_9VIRU|nr:WSSV156 [White spot syndrome virus]QHB92585.1 hypothetical protein [White spot syndrome virus]QHB92586.1 hypothetical protein [White spot syndrome virus]